MKNLITTNETFLKMTKATKIDKEIGAKIELHRNIKRKSRHWLADKIKLSYQQIQNYEIGKHRVAASCLLKIAQSLKTPINQFFPDKNDRKQ